MTHPLTTAILDEDVSAILNILKNNTSGKTVEIVESKVKSVKKIKSSEEYVYDIGMKNDKHPWFFANNMLLHNSVYFTAYPALKDRIDSGEIEWNKESVIKLYDDVSDVVSDTFPDFALETFNIPKKYGKVLKAGREIVGENALFIKRKRYSILVYDDEGTRKDVGGSIGKIKVTGLDLRRSDTPVFMQVFLKEILTDVLTGKEESYVINKIREFKDTFSTMPPWEKGTPKAVNGLTKYLIKQDEHLAKKLSGVESKLSIPGHVTGSINWNTMRDINGDMHSMKILDGTKIKVCYLKTTDGNNMKNIAYPVDEPHLPDWFKALAFDERKMMETIVDKKITNLLGVVGWDLNKTTKQDQIFETLFTMPKK